MKEIEVKILEVNRKEVEDKLISLGAKKVFDDEMHAIIFDFPDRPMKKNNELIRLRKEGKETTLTFKKPIPHEEIKVKEEFEVKVSDFEETKKILESLGLTTWFDVKKTRVSYVLDDSHFEFDKYLEDYNFIPEFLEIEVKNEEDLYKQVEMLGFNKEDCVPWVFPELIDYYQKKKSPVK